jgi:hypothetical protein
MLQPDILLLVAPTAVAMSHRRQVVISAGCQDPSMISFQPHRIILVSDLALCHASPVLRAPLITHIHQRCLCFKADW